MTRQRITLAELKAKAQQTPIKDDENVVNALTAAHNHPAITSSKNPFIFSSNDVANRFTTVAFSSSLSMSIAMSVVYPFVTMYGVDVPTLIFFIPSVLKHLSYFFQQDEYAKSITIFDFLSNLILLKNYSRQKPFETAFIFFPLLCMQYLLFSGSELGFDIRKINDEAKKLIAEGANQQSLPRIIGAKTERASLENKYPFITNTTLMQVIFAAFLLMGLSSDERRGLGFIAIISSLLVPVFYFIRQPSNKFNLQKIDASRTQADTFIIEANKALHNFKIQFEKISELEGRQYWTSVTATCGNKFVDEAENLLVSRFGMNRKNSEVAQDLVSKTFKKITVVTIMKIKIPAGGVYVTQTLLSLGATLDAVRAGITACGFSSFHFEEKSEKRKNYITMLVDLHAAENVSDQICKFLTDNIIEYLKHAEKIEIKLQEEEHKQSRKNGMFSVDQAGNILDIEQDIIASAAAVAEPVRSKIKIKTKGEARENNVPTISAEKPNLFSWENLFDGESINSKALPDDVKRYPMIDSIDASQPFICWDAEMLDNNSGDIEILRNIFEEAAEKPRIQDKLKLLTERVRYTGQNFKVYELRGHCDTRILGVDVSNPGEAPFIFLTHSCNHAAINPGKFIAVKKALDRAPTVTINLISQRDADNVARSLPAMF